ncbi:hypothetical protein OG552_19455 [Streptomyces sp. NBC_01476]|uniref:hypothetical protein n=1 Tax=Streptomyces sp. NBC_01476 TaxID=2903881 RepID=UPI002E361591|nr:hypothetical protein [Streptomyces sp. NBC_01476]
MGIRATVGGTDTGASAPGAEAGPAGAPDLEVRAGGCRDSDKPTCAHPFVTPRADTDQPNTPELDADRVNLAAFLHDGVAALDRPRLSVDHPDSRPMKPRRLRPRGAEPRDRHRSTRFAASEIAVVERAVAERGPSFSGFVADAAVAVATNRVAALLPHERALRAFGEELGRALYALGKVGNNLNQLVRQGHMDIPVEPSRVEHTLARLDDVLAEIHDVTLRLNEAA